MSPLARAKSQVAVHFVHALPFALGANAVALFILDWTGQIPSWVKTAAALFLAF